MNAENLYIGLPSMLAFLVTIVGLLRWVSKLKSRIVVLETLRTIQQEENEKIHLRITKTQDEGKLFKTESDNSIKEIQKQIHEVEKNIIKAIKNSK